MSYKNYFTQRLVILGGGHSHVYVLKNIKNYAHNNLEIILVSNTMHTPYSGMFPGYIAGNYSFDECHIDLLPLSSYANCKLIYDEVVEIDTERGVLKFKEHSDLFYDFLSINTGSTPNMRSIKGAESFGIPVKPIPIFLEKWGRILNKIISMKKVFNFTVIGGGAGGVEVVLATQYRLKTGVRKKTRVLLKVYSII